MDLSNETAEQFNYLPEIDLTKHNFKELTEYKNVLIFSKASLQHIPKGIIKDIHLNLMKNFPRHEIIHLINCNDHRHHTDKSLSKYEFLKYSDSKWSKLCTRFDYHNRMRLNEYTQLFEDLGYKLETVFFEEANLRDLQDYRSNILPYLDDRFLKFSLIDNTAGSLLLKLKYQK
jgi:hypothetical protein